MALICMRLGNKQLLSTICRIPTLSSAQFVQSAAGIPKITYKNYEPPEPLHHDERNAKMNRPLSPHLTIYQPQLTSMLSITHRITGMVLSGYMSVLGIGALVLPHDISYYVTLMESLNMSSVALFSIKAVLAAPFAYHFANGIRHLFWDTARGLTIKEVYKSGYIMLGSSVVLTIILAVL